MTPAGLPGLRFIASSMGPDGQGFGFEDYVNQSVAALNKSRNNSLSYDLDGPDIFLSTMAGDEVMVRLTVEKSDHPPEGGFIICLLRPSRRGGGNSSTTPSCMRIGLIDFGPM